MIDLMSYFLSDFGLSSFYFSDPVRKETEEEVVYYLSAPGLDKITATLEGKTLHLDYRRRDRERRIDLVLRESDLDELRVEYYRGEVKICIPKSGGNKTRDIPVVIKD